MAEIVLDEVDKVYPGGIKGIDNLSLDIADGEFMVLVGPSGSGKTTALRMLAGLEPLDGGRVEIEGRDVTWVPPKDRDIAMVFQNYALYPHMTVEQNLAFGLHQRKTPKDETRRRVLSVAKMLGLERFFDQEVILGVRPSDFEDAELADPSWARMPVKADVTEKLGSEIHVIFTLDAPIVEHSSLSQAISDEDDDSAIALAGGKSQWTARVAARSHVKPGERIELAIDASGLRSSIPTAGWPSVTRWTRRLRFLAPPLPLAQPFTAPAVSPDTTDRRKTNTRIPIGTRATTLAAKMVP